MDKYLGKTVWRRLPLANNNSPLIRPSYNLLAELRTRLDHLVIPSHVCVGSPATYRLATLQRTSVSHPVILVLVHTILVLTSIERAVETPQTCRRGPRRLELDPLGIARLSCGDKEG